jgi:hypothetical protein
VRDHAHVDVPTDRRLTQLFNRTWDAKPVTTSFKHRSSAGHTVPYVSRRRAQTTKYRTDCNTVRAPTSKRWSRLLVFQVPKVVLHPNYPHGLSDRERTAIVWRRVHRLGLDGEAVRERSKAILPAVVASLWRDSDSDGSSSFFGQVGRIRSQRLGRAHMHRLSHTHPAPCRTLVHPHAHTHTTHSSPMQLSTCTRFPSRFPCSAPLLLVRQRPDDQVPTAGDRNR